MSLSSAVLFGVFVLVAYGVQDFLIAIVSRKIGVLRSSIWLLLTQLVFLVVLAPFLYVQINVTSTIIIIAVLTGLLWVLGLILFTKSLIEGNISVVVTITSAWGAVTAILALILFKEVLSTMQALDISMVVLGTVLLSFDLNSFLRGKKRTRAVGMSYALPTMLIYGAVFFLTSLMAKLAGWFDAAFFITIPAVFFMFVYGFAINDGINVNRVQIPVLVLIGCLGLIGFFSYNLGTQYNYTSIVAPISAASPLITVLLASVIVKEKLSGNQFLGIALVIVGLALLAI